MGFVAFKNARAIFFEVWQGGQHLDKICENLGGSLGCTSGIFGDAYELWLPTWRAKDTCNWKI